MFPKRKRKKNYAFSRNLTKARRLKEWTQAQAIGKIDPDLKKATYSAWETGRNEPSLDYIAKILAVFKPSDPVQFLSGKSVECILSSL